MTCPKFFQLSKHSDNRGCFYEKYHKEIQNNLKIEWKQENFSISKKNVLRGLHYQLKSPQEKLVHCIYGEILDVIVDIRVDSKTYGKHFKYFLNQENILFVPSGFAHGFLSLKENTIVEYKCSNYYMPNDQYTILWNDKNLNIDWGVNNPILSEKDSNGFTFESAPKFM
jgi:dTDP-4-dehydrorhamnose 3,5-epimerase